MDTTVNISDVHLVIPYRHISRGISREKSMQYNMIQNIPEIL